MQNSDGDSIMILPFRIYDPTSDQIFTLENTRQTVHNRASYEVERVTIDAKEKQPKICQICACLLTDSAHTVHLTVPKC